MAETDLIRALRGLDSPVVPPQEERERIWHAIAALVDDESCPQDAVAPTAVARPAILSRGLWRMVAVAVVVLVMGMTAVLIAGRGGIPGGDSLAGPHVEGTVDLPDSHPAAELLDLGVDDITTFSHAAEEREMAYQCVAGGMTQVCLVHADGLVAMVPLAAGSGFTLTLSGGAVDEEVTVPLDRGPLAVPGPGGRFTAVIEDAAGERVAGTQGALFDSQPPRDGVELREPIISELENGASYAVGTGDSGILCVQAGSATESLQSCGRERTLVAVAFQADQRLVVAGYVPAPVGRVTALLDDDRRLPLELTPIPGQEMLAFGLIERATTEFVAIEVRDENGEIIQTHFPSLGPVEQ